jgi:hypothetical protein
MSEITKTVSVPKTLPMKHKCLMYGAIALWESLKAKGIVCESNFMDVVNLDVGEQIKFLDSMIDVNYLEKEVVKPLQKAHKKELADAKKPVKEKKVRAPRAKKDAEKKAEPVIIQTPGSYDKATEELVEELSYEKVDLPPLTIEKPVEEKKKPKIRKQKATEEKEEKAPKEKKPRKKAAKAEPKVEAKEDPPDYWMLFHENVRYWTTDENLKNGILYDNIVDDEGDFGPGLIVGNLVNGEVVRI